MAPFQARASILRQASKAHLAARTDDIITDLSAGACSPRRADLHTHSTCSDGQWSPAALVEEAARAGISILALTDHDTVAGLTEFERAGPAHGVWAISGIEVSAALDQRAYHILCYGVDPRSSTWETLASAREAGRERMYERLFAQVRRMGYRLEEKAARDESGGLVAHPLQSALQGAGHPDPAGETRRLFRSAILPLLVLRSVPVERLGEIIAGEGVLCSVAHPAREETGVSSRLTVDDLERIRQVMPLHALEAYHPMHNSAQRDYALELAERHGLMVTCGSDAHGHRVGRPPIAYSAELCRPFLEKLRQLQVEMARYPRDGATSALGNGCSRGPW